MKTGIFKFDTNIWIQVESFSTYTDPKLRITLSVTNIPDNIEFKDVCILLSIVSQIKNINKIIDIDQHKQKYIEYSKLADVVDNWYKK